MAPLQALFDPVMAIVLLGILTTLAIMFGFIWAYGKIREPPKTDDHKGNGHGA